MPLGKENVLAPPMKHIFTQYGSVMKIKQKINLPTAQPGKPVCIRENELYLVFASAKKTPMTLITE